MIGLNAQLLEARFQAVARQIFAIQHPTSAQLGNTALRTMTQQQFPAVGIERQIRSQPAKCRQIKETGAGIAVDRSRLCILVPINLEVGRRDTQAILRQKLNLLSGDSPVIGLVIPLEAPAHAGQLKFGKLAAKADPQLFKCNISGYLASPFVEISPDPQGTASFRQVNRIINPGSPSGEVGIIQLDKYLSGQALKRLAEIPLDLATHVDTRSQFIRRGCRQAKAMMSPAVVQRELQIFKHQRWRLAQLVFPDDGCIPDTDLLLFQHPFGKCRIALALGIHPGHRNLAIRIAAYMQYRPVKSQ